MKVLSLFSGVGGFDLGLENAGMETVFQCEWDKHATNILERHWPHVPRWGDVSTLTGQHILAHAPVVDVVAWGSPCQDLSVAGKRAGLQGARSGLFHEGVRIIKELRELTNGKYPRISIWENVAGALSSGAGADFGQVLTEMDEAGACFSEWRILDAQYFGVPQRRRRVFLISVFDTATAARCPDPLLPVREGVQWHPQTSNQARQTVAGEVAGRLRSGGAGGVPSSRGEHLVVEPFTPSQFAQYVEGVGTLRSNGGDLAGGSETLAVYTKSKRPQSATDDETWVANQPNPTLNAFDQGDTRATTVIVGSLQARDYKGANHEGARDGKLVTEPILLDGRRNDDVRVYDPPVQTLQARMGTGGNNVPVIGFSHTQGLSAQPSEVAWPTLRTEGNGMAVAYVAAGFKPGASADARTIGYEEELSPSLEAGGGGNNKPAVVIQYDGYNQKIHVDEPSVTLRIGRDSSDFVAQPVVFEPGAISRLEGERHSEKVSHTLRAEMGDNKPAVMTPTMAVRRLTPLECERLMGWPDDWTAGQSDTHRYKQCGNGVASPVAQWIGEILIATDASTTDTDCA